MLGSHRSGQKVLPSSGCLSLYGETLVLNPGELTPEGSPGRVAGAWRPVLQEPLEGASQPVGPFLRCGVWANQLISSPVEELRALCPGEEETGGGGQW